MDGLILTTVNRLAAFFAIVVLAAACGGGGGGDDGGAANDTDTDGNLTISGKATFDLVPHNPANNGLAYGSTSTAPVRNAVIQLVRAADQAVIATAETDSVGDFSVQSPLNTDVIIRVRAEMVRSGMPGWDVRVVDNTQNNALYVLESSGFNTGASDLVRDLHAGSGWGGSSYTGTRSAAPFAIIDGINDAILGLLSTDPNSQLPPLIVRWSPDNRAVSGDESIGEIGNSFFRRIGNNTREILLLGNENSDTDEYDRHVVIHEFGHYFEDALVRADTIGGAHSNGDRLDPRVAFSEGWGYAYAGIATGDPVTRDALGFGQASGFQIDVESNNVLNPGWFSEGSVQSIIYDIVDLDADGVDALALGFAPVYDLLTGGMAASVSPITIFSFVAMLKQQNPDDSAAIDAIVNAQEIASTTIDEFATSESNDEGRGSDVLPVYSNLTIDGSSVNVCALGGDSDFGTYNKLSVRRFVRFDVVVPGNYRIRAAGPAGADPDIVLHSSGYLTMSELIGTTETLDIQLAPASYVLETYEYSNTTDDARGRTCIDVSVQSL